MPARRAYTVKELRRRLEQSREAGRIRTARWRARLALRAGVDEEVTVTPDAPVTVTGDGQSGVTETPVTVTPGALSPPDPPSPVRSSPSPSPSEKEAVARAVLRGFRDRGYKDDARFWRVVAEKYPGLDVELEAYKIAEWLTEPRNARRLCSKRFLDAWLSRADADRHRGTEPGPTTVSPKGVIVVGNGTPYAPPAAFQRNLEKTYKAPEDYTSEDLVKSDEARRRVLESLPPRLRGKWQQR